MRASLPVLLLLGLGCGPQPSPAPPPAAAAAPSASAPDVPPASCSPDLDIGALVARHERVFGSRDALARALPVSVVGTLRKGSKTGTASLVIDRQGFRSESLLSGLVSTSGQTPAGEVWAVSAAHGVRETLAGAEAVDEAITFWFWRRDYLNDLARAQVRCADEHPDRVTLALSRPELGNPQLTFLLASSALVSVDHASTDGSPARVSAGGWSPPDASGLRWPTDVTFSSSEEPLVLTTPVPTPGLACARLTLNDPPRGETGPACLEPMGDRAWVGSPASVVRVPMIFAGGELIVKARYRGQEFNAMLDSGAGISVLEASSMPASAFVPSAEVTAVGVSQKMRVGVGQLVAVDIGELHISKMPVASIPIPVLAAFGNLRPDLVLGYTLFARGAVRVDYARGEIAFASRGEDLTRGHEGSLHAVPMRVLDGKFVVEVSLDGMTAPLALDTGNSGQISLTKRWADAHGLPGDRPSVTLRMLSGAGDVETDEVLFRLRKASLGPLVSDGAKTNISPEPGSSTIAGLVGNALLARCDAVIFDHRRRTLWLEGACDRPVPPASFGWRLMPADDRAFPGRPWVVHKLMPDGAAARAGVRQGDRLLEIGGSPATIDVLPIWRLEEQPVGTKIPAVVARAGKKQRVTIELRALLAP